MINNSNKGITSNKRSKEGVKRPNNININRITTKPIPCNIKLAVVPAKTTCLKSTLTLPNRSFLDNTAVIELRIDSEKAIQGHKPTAK